MSLYRARSFNDTNNFYDLFDGSRSTQIRSSNMDAHQNVLYAAGLPALISTGITLLYLLVKTFRFAFYALSNKTEGRLAATTPCSGQPEQCSIEGEEGHTEVYQQIPRDITEQNGIGAQRPSGSLPVSKRWKDLCLSTCRDATQYSVEPVVRQSDKRLSSKRCRTTTNSYGQGPSGTHDDSSGVLTEGGGWSNATNG